MGKTASEIVKILASIILSSLMTIVIMSGTVIKGKADKDYVDKEDKKLDVKIEKVRNDYEKDCEVLKEDFLREVKDMKESQQTIESDIKELLKRN